MALKELIIGASGFIGGTLAGMVPGALISSSRRGNALLLDLRDVRDVPECDIAYICGGANGAKTCEGSTDAFRINVDGAIDVARIVSGRGGFAVYISSMTVEWAPTAYARQKLAAETALRTMRGVGVVRSGRVVKDNVADLCETLIHVGRARVEGLTRWGSDDIAYQK